MIQAGNLKTRGLSREKSLPSDSDEATIKAETMPEKFVHVRGYIGAAREGDDTNPEKKSSFSQFYIVTGKYYTDMDLDEMEAGRSWKYTPEQREAYKLQGGAAHLDGGYTVFGRLLDGWGTVDKIQRVETDDNNRPLKTSSSTHAPLHPEEVACTPYQIQADAPHQVLDAGRRLIYSFRSKTKYREPWLYAYLFVYLTTLKLQLSGFHSQLTTN